MKSFKLMSAFLLFTVSISLYAQNETVSTEDKQTFRIIGKREIYDPKSTSLNTTIITADEIKNTGAKTVAEAIKNVPGITIVKRLNSTLVHVRGMSPERITVLLNGQKLNIASGNAGDGVDLSLYNTANVERIEIIRGSAATRYGGNSVGGVINIITKEKATNIDGVDSSLLYGSYNTMLASSLISKSFGKNNQGSILIDGSLYYNEGNYDYSYKAANGQTVAGKMKNNDSMVGSARIGLGYKLNDDGDTLYASVSGSIQKYGSPGSYRKNSTTYNFSDGRYNKGEYTANISYENYSIDVFNLFLRAATMFQNKEYKEGAYTTKHDNSATEVGAMLEREDIFGDGIFTLKNNIGLEYANDYYMPRPPRTDCLTGDGKSVYRNTVSIYYTPTLSFLNYDGTSTPRISVFPAIRFDAVIGGGAKTNVNYYEPTYSFGAMYTFDKERRYIIKGNFSTSYKLPNFNDLYWPSDSFTAGNPNLKKESAVGGDIGFVISPINIINIEASYYMNGINDLIAWAPDDAFIYRPSNIDKALVQGVETMLSFNIPAEVIKSIFEISAGYTYESAKSQKGPEKGKHIPRMPNNKANAMIGYVYENDIVTPRINFSVSYIGDRYNDPGNKDKLQAYTVLDLALSLKILQKITFEGGVKNLADVRYENASGYPLAGREYYVGINGRF